MANNLLHQLLINSNLSPRWFLIRTLVYLPILLILGYLLSAWLVRPALELAQWLLPLGLPHLIEAADIQQHYLMLHTYLGAHSSAELPQGFARFSANFFVTGQHYPFLLTLPLDSLKYAYGLPVLSALVLASPGQASTKLMTLFLGWGLVSLIVVWGLYFNTANLLVLDFKPALTNQAKTLWPLFNEELVQAFIALAYRIGFLIFPAVLPILLWAQRNPLFLEQLIHGSLRYESKPQT